MVEKTPWLWDYDIRPEQFREILEGRLTIGRLDSQWAAIRLLEYAPYGDIVRLLMNVPVLRGPGRAVGNELEELLLDFRRETSTETGDRRFRCAK